MKVKQLIGCAGLAIAATSAVVAGAPGTSHATGAGCIWEPTGETRQDGAEYREDWGVSRYGDSFKRMIRVWRCDNGVFYLDRVELEEVNPDGTPKRGDGEHEPILT